MLKKQLACFAHVIQYVVIFTLIVIPLSLDSLNIPGVYAGEGYTWELKKGVVSAENMYILRMLLLEKTIQATTVYVNSADGTVKSSYLGTQSNSGGGWFIDGNINWTMDGTYSSSQGMKGQYTYKAYITGTNPAGKKDIQDVLLTGSFTGPVSLSSSKYTVSFGTGTGRITDNSDNIGPWFATFAVTQPEISNTGTRFGGITGVVRVLFPQDAPRGWRAAKADMVLPVGTHIRTEDDSGCVLHFADLSTFVLKQNCEIVLESPPDKDAKVDLIKGSVWSKVKEMFKTGTMEIEMNQAVTSIKGTTLVCEETGNASTVKVIEGNVDFKSKKTGQTVNVNAGKMVTGTSAGLSSITSFDINQEQAKWQNIASSTSSSSVIDDIQQDQVMIQGNDDSMSSSLLPQDGSGSSSGTSGQTSTTKKKIKIGPLSCFIATAAYGSETAKELNTLRSFRDRVLMQSEQGKWFVDTYYQFSPPLAEYIGEHENLRIIVRELFLDPVVNILKSTELYWNN